MSRIAAMLLALGALVACGSDAVGVEGSCVAVVNVHGVLYGTSSDAVADPLVVADEVYLEVTRSTGCLDQGQPSAPLASGESNFLPAGTTLHRIVGFEPEIRLAYWSSEIEEWLAASPLPSA